MGNQFQVDTERITAAAGGVRRCSDDIDAAMARMMGQLTGLQDAWRGAAAGRFQDTVAEWRATQARVREALDHIGLALGQAGQQYQAAEAQNAAMFR